MKLDDLDDDCLMEILERLPPKQLMKVARVNKKLRDLVAVKLRVKIKVISVHRIKQNDWYSSTCPHLNSEDTIDQEMALKIEEQNDTIDSRIAVLLAKCSGVKSVRFRNYPLNGNHLQQLIQHCSQVECIKFTGSPAKLEDWNQFFDRTGQQIVHLQWTFDSETFTQFSMNQFMEMVVLKCVNIKQVDLVSHQSEGLVELIKKLPKSCRINLHFNKVTTINPTEDLVENIDAILCSDSRQKLNWSGFRNRVERLSWLRFNRLTFGPADDLHLHGVVFNGLKKLECVLHPAHPRMIECLSISRFPQLEEITLQVGHISEGDFIAVLKQMQSVKKVYFFFLIKNFDGMSLFPESAIDLLKNVQRIKFRFKMRLLMEPDQLQHQVKQLFQPIENWTERVARKPTIIKFFFRLDFFPDNNWSQAFVDWLKQVVDKANSIRAEAKSEEALKGEK